MPRKLHLSGIKGIEVRSGFVQPLIILEATERTWKYLRRSIERHFLDLLQDLSFSRQPECEPRLGSSNRWGRRMIYIYTQPTSTTVKLYGIPSPLDRTLQVELKSSNVQKSCWIMASVCYVLGCCVYVGVSFNILLGRVLFDGITLA